MGVDFRSVLLEVGILHREADVENETHGVDGGIRCRVFHVELFAVAHGC